VNGWIRYQCLARKKMKVRNLFLFVSFFLSFA